MKMKVYVEFVDPEGATVGYGGQFASISHRVLFENKAFYGFESASKVFNSHRELIDCLQHAIAQPHGTAGAHGKVSWSVERC